MKYLSSVFITVLAFIITHNLSAIRRIQTSSREHISETTRTIEDAGFDQEESQTLLSFLYLGSCWEDISIRHENYESHPIILALNQCHTYIINHQKPNLAVFIAQIHLLGQAIVDTSILNNLDFFKNLVEQSIEETDIASDNLRSVHQQLQTIKTDLYTLFTQTSPSNTDMLPERSKVYRELAACIYAMQDEILVLNELVAPFQQFDQTIQTAGRRIMRTYFNSLYTYMEHKQMPTNCFYLMFDQHGLIEKSRQITLLKPFPSA